MATKTAAGSPQDLNSIPYDAPLRFPEPSPGWVRKQTRKGNKGNTLTTATVPDADLHGKNIIVSGANNGIGREASLQFAAWGANVILACRDPPSHETHPEAVVEECKSKARSMGHDRTEFEWWQLDMANMAGVEAFAQRWLDTGRQLDICNNAGMGSSPGGSTTFKKKDGFEIIHQVNFLSHVLLTLRLLPSIKKSPAPRIVCTTSCFHYPGKFDLKNFNGDVPNSTGIDGVQFYMNNKLWYQTWLTELQHRLLQHSEYRHITVNGVHPGYVNSGVWTMNKSQPWKTYFLQRLAWFLAISPQQGSLAITHAATSVDAGPDPAIQGVGEEGGKGGGRYFNRVWEEEPMPHTKDQDFRLRVWRKVNDELQLEENGLLDILGLYSKG